MKHIFLVDFENVHTDGMKGIKSIAERDEIVIFYSDKDEASIDFIRELRDDIQCARIAKNGKNALDFQLSSYLGFLIKDAACENALSQTRFVIVSKDAGYDCVINFWINTEFSKHLNVSPDIKRAGSIHSALFPAQAKQAAAVVQQSPKNTRVKEIDELMAEAKTLKDFHNALVKKFGMPTGGDLYKENKARFRTCSIL